MRSSTSERVASLEQRLSDHEARCEERLIEIRTAAGHTLRAVEGLKGRFWAICLSLLAWAFAQLWSAEQARIGRLEVTPSLSAGGLDAASPTSPNAAETS